ncbi:hypothetical protein [Mycobacterium sp. 4858]|uniref:hypothetical protein n=1 Tax=Mycobacterium sp. 4858 TaxID=2057185 RepID=UPI00350FBC76
MPSDDLYAVGVVGFEALTGRRPFPQEDLGALAHAILHDSPPPVAALRPDVPPPLAAAIERAMARDPARRFDQAGTMRAALAGRAVAARSTGTRVMDAPVVAPLTYTFVGAPPEPATPRRKWWVAAIVAAFVLALLLLAIDPPFSASPPTPVNTTTTPAPPPTTTTTTPTTTTTLPAPQGPPPHPGKHKGGHGG